MPNDHREGDVYLTVVPDEPWTSLLKVTKATQNEPTAVPAGAVVIKVRLRIPKAAFKPLQPEAVVTVPESLVHQPVEAVAVDPDIEGAAV